MPLKPVPVFGRGDLVRWTSQARGSVRHHVGVVVLVVPGGVPLGPLLESLGRRYSLRAMQRSQGPRPDTSYLVALTGARGRGKARLHWPHAALLVPYSGPQEAPAVDIAVPVAAAVVAVAADADAGVAGDGGG